MLEAYLKKNHARSIKKAKQQKTQIATICGLFAKTMKKPCTQHQKQTENTQVAMISMEKQKTHANNNKNAKAQTTAGGGFLLF